jgi:ribosomal protein L16 Arg81 hydroxylase
MIEVQGRFAHVSPPDGCSQEARMPVEWRFWMAENQLLGTSEEQIRAALIDAGFGSSLVQAEIDEIRNDPCYLLADRMAQRYNKLKALLGVRDSLCRLSYGAGSIERRSKISQNEFIERYYSANRPVILTGLLANTTAKKRWTPQYLAEVCGDSTVEVMAGRQNDPRYEINSEAHKSQMKMSEYVRMVLEYGPSNDYYLVANNGFFERPDTQRLYSEVPQLPEYLDHADAKGKVFFWFGPAGTVTPLHHDVMNVLLAQIYGRKRFTLIPPEQIPYVYNETGVYGEVDCERPDYDSYPLYREVHPLRFVLGPGELLFIPVGWFHHVRALDVSMTVSYTNFYFPNSYEWVHPQIR